MKNIAFIFGLLFSVAALSQSTNLTATKIRAEESLRIGTSTSQKVEGFDLTVPRTPAHNKLPTTKCIIDWVTGNVIMMGGTAGGDLDGTYPSPTVDRIQGFPISATVPIMGQVLKWSGSQWVPDTDNSSGTTDLSLSTGSSPVTLNSSTGNDVTITAGTSIGLSSTSSNLTITNTAPDQVVSLINGGGIGVSGTYPSFTLTASDQSATNEIQRLDTFDIVGNILRASLLNDGVPASTANLAAYLDNTDGQTLSFIEPNLTISGGNSVDLSGLTPTTEELQDGVGAMVSGNSESLISVTYDDAAGKLDFAVTPTLSSYTNDAGFLTSEVDGSATNEGTLGVGAGSGTSSVILSNTSGATGVTINAAGINTISETTSANGGQITITGTEVDGSVTNEIQTLANTSDATSHTVTLSGPNGSLKLIEGTNISLTTAGTSSDGEVTISASGSAVTAWGDITGTLSDQTDLQAALDGKVDENAAITGATKTKITYDSKGLVTAGADATTSDISEGSNLYYTDERAQDGVGTILVDGSTLNFTYSDPTPSITAEVITQMSITSDGSGVKLSGDQTTPGNNMLYGTNGSGTKGWYSQPTGTNIYNASGAIPSSTARDVDIPNTSSLYLHTTNENAFVNISNGILSLAGADVAEILTGSAAKFSLEPTTVTLQSSTTNQFFIDETQNTWAFDVPTVIDDNQATPTGLKYSANYEAQIITDNRAITDVGSVKALYNGGTESVLLTNTGLEVEDTDGSHGLTFKPGSNLTADRTLTITTGDADRTLTMTGDASITGTNSGDVTVSGENYISLAGQAITANAVNLSNTNVTGTLAAARFGALTGDVTNSAGSYATTIANDAVSNAKLANMATQTIKGRTTAGTGDPEDLTASQTKTILALDNVENTALSSWAGSSNLITLGTVTTGTWNATTIGISKGGTGQTTANAALNALLPTQTGNNGKFLQTDGSNTSWVASSGSGTVTDVSVVSANGLAGSVANSTTTPAITLSTTITGVLKGNGTAISAATGSDIPVQMSIVNDASGIKLDGDASSPGNSKLYGTNGSGVKGWYDQPSGGGAVATDAIWDNKGDLAVATGADAASKLAVGTDAKQIYADASTSTGLRWGPSVISPSQITSDQDNYSPTGWANAQIIRISGDNGFRAITSFASTFDGDRKTLMNTGDYCLYIPAEHPDGTAANRVIGRYDFYLFPGKTVDMIYDGTSSRWRLVSDGNFDFEYAKGITMTWVYGTTTSSTNFLATATGTGSSITSTDGSGDLLGHCLWSTGTTSTGAVRGVFNNGGGIHYTDFGKAHAWAETMISIPTLSTSSERYIVNFTIDDTGNGNSLNNNACGIRYKDDINSGKWEGYSRDNAGAESTVDLGVTVTADITYKLRVEIDKSRSEVRFYVVGSNTLYTGRVTGNLPNANLNLADRLLLLKSVGTTARTLRVTSMRGGVIWP